MSRRVFFANVVLPAKPVVTAATMSGGQFAFVVEGDAGTDYHVEASTNLIHWTPIFSTNSPALPFFWSDPAAAQWPVRFYRVMLGP